MYLICQKSLLLTLSEIIVIHFTRIVLSGDKTFKVSAILCATGTSISFVDNVCTVHTIGVVHAHCTVLIDGTDHVASAKVTFRTNDDVRAFLLYLTSTILCRLYRFRFQRRPFPRFALTVSIATLTPSVPCSPICWNRGPGEKKIENCFLIKIFTRRCTAV